MSSDVEHLAQLFRVAHINNAPQNPTLCNITYCHGKLITRNFIPEHTFIGTIHGKMLNVYEIEELTANHVIIDDETILDTSINYDNNVLNYIKHSDETETHGNCCVQKQIDYMNGIATIQVYSIRNIQGGEEVSLI